MKFTLALLALSLLPSAFAAQDVCVPMERMIEGSIEAKAFEKYGEGLYLMMVQTRECDVICTGLGPRKPYLEYWTTVPSNPNQMAIYRFNEARIRSSGGWWGEHVDTYFADAHFELSLEASGLSSTSVMGVPVYHPGEIKRSEVTRGSEIELGTIDQKIMSDVASSSQRSLLEAWRERLHNTWRVKPASNVLITVSDDGKRACLSF